MKKIDLFNDLWITEPLTIQQKNKLLILLQSIGLVISERSLRKLYANHEEYPMFCRTSAREVDFQVCCISRDWDTGTVKRIPITHDELVKLIKDYHVESKTG